MIYFTIENVRWNEAVSRRDDIPAAGRCNSQIYNIRPIITGAM